MLISRIFPVPVDGFPSWEIDRDILFHHGYYTKKSIGHRRRQKRSFQRPFMRALIANRKLVGNRALPPARLHPSLIRSNTAILASAQLCKRPHRHCPPIPRMA
jgi:hypothetical protein